MPDSITSPIVTAFSVSLNAYFPKDNLATASTMSCFTRFRFYKRISWIANILQYNKDRINL